MKISNGSISISIQEFIQSIDESINLNDKDTINNLLNLLKEQKVVQNRLSLFDGVFIIGIISAFALGLGYFG